MGIKLEQFNKANKGLKKLINTDFNKYELEEYLIDGLINGCIQKFEYTTELCWKSIREYLLENDGLKINSPKQVIKEFYNIGYVNEPNYFALLNALNDRNLLSHIYDEEEVLEVVQRIKNYTFSYDEVIRILNNE